jgi:hypothetical protein
VPRGHELDPAPVELHRAAEVRVADVDPFGGDLGREFDDRDDDRAGARGDLDGVAEMVAVPVREQDDVGRDLVRLRRRLGVVVQERVDEDVGPASGEVEGRMTQPPDASVGPGR